MTNTEAFADRMARADKAFTRHVIEKVSLRDLQPEMGVSYETIRSDVAAFKRYLTEGGAELAERRASFLAEVDAIKARALYIYEKFKDTKPLVATAAMNTYTATLAHQRAVEGLDHPKEAKVEQSGEVRIIWDDGTDAPPDPSYGEPVLTGGYRG